MSKRISRCRDNKQYASHAFDKLLARQPKIKATGAIEDWLQTLSPKHHISPSSPSDSPSPLPSSPKATRLACLRTTTSRPKAAPLQPSYGNQLPPPPPPSAPPRHSTLKRRMSQAFDEPATGDVSGRMLRRHRTNPTQSKDQSDERRVGQLQSRNTTQGRRQGRKPTIGDGDDDNQKEDEDIQVRQRKSSRKGPERIKLGTNVPIMTSHNADVDGLRNVTTGSKQRLPSAPSSPSKPSPSKRSNASPSKKSDPVKVKAPPNVEKRQQMAHMTPPIRFKTISDWKPIETSLPVKQLWFEYIRTIGECFIPLDFKVTCSSS